MPTEDRVARVTEGASKGYSPSGEIGNEPTTAVTGKGDADRYTGTAGNLWYIAVTDFPHGMGSTARSRSMCQALSLAGYDTLLLIPHAIGHGRNDASNGCVDGVRFEYLNGSTVRPLGPVAVALTKLRGNLSLLRRIVAARSRLAAILAYNASLFDCWGVLVMGRILGIPVILDQTDEWYDPSIPVATLGVPRFVFQRLAKATEGILYRLSSHVIVASTHLEHRVARYAASVTRFPVAFDPSIYVNAEPNRLTSPDDFAVLYAGSVSNIEGVDILIDAFRRVSTSLGPRARLFVVGNPAHNEAVERYEKLAAEMVQSRCVTFLPAVDRARYASLLRGADLLVIPRPTSVASSAGFPYKLVEYLASGTPVLVTRFGDVKQYFESGVHCLMCAPDDALALSRGIVAAAQQEPGTLAALAAEGQRRVRQLFAFESVANGLHQLLERISVRRSRHHRDGTPPRRE